MDWVHFDVGCSLTTDKICEVCRQVRHYFLNPSGQRLNNRCVDFGKPCYDNIVPES